VPFPHHQWCAEPLRLRARGVFLRALPDRRVRAGLREGDRWGLSRRDLQHGAGADRAAAQVVGACDGLHRRRRRDSGQPVGLCDRPQRVGGRHPDGDGGGRAGWNAVPEQRERPRPRHEKGQRGHPHQGNDPGRAFSDRPPYGPSPARDCRSASDPMSADARRSGGHRLSPSRPCAGFSGPRPVCTTWWTSGLTPMRTVSEHVFA
jgi:hypothetical protein